MVSSVSAAAARFVAAISETCTCIAREGANTSIASAFECTLG